MSDTADLYILVALLVANLIGTFAAHWTLAARVRELRDEVLAAELGRDDLDRSSRTEPRGHHVDDLHVAVHEGLDDEDHAVFQVCLDGDAGTLAVLRTVYDGTEAREYAAVEAYRRGLGDPR